MAENKENTGASKLAQSIKRNPSEGSQDAAAATIDEALANANANIQVGASVGGSRIANPHGPAGVQEIKRAPGYYSRHAGKVRIGQKTWMWPMEAPLNPTKDEPELKEVLDDMVRRKLAIKVD